jgi:GTPase SAR1 family protein
MSETFREQVKQRLSGFSRKDVCYFAWLCAVRALPFLSVTGCFDYWTRKDSDKRQNFLWDVLRAIDISTGVAARTAANASIYAAEAAIYARTISNNAANNAASYAEAAANNAEAAANNADRLRFILLDDLENIRNKKYNFQNDLAIYGNVWDSFQSALRDLDCGYWGDWYARLFAKRFMLDECDREEIKLRLSVPGEIVARGAASVARYVMDLNEKGAARLNEARAIILGSKGSGKTSLARRLNNPLAQMPKVDESTEGVDVNNWVIPVDSKQTISQVNVHVWDFAGHIITHSVHPCFMSERCLYILVVDGRTEGDGRTEYWLEQIRHYGGVDSPVLVLVNIRDEHYVDLPKNTLKEEFPSIIGFYSVDIDAGGKPLENFRQDVMELLRDKPLWKNQQISAPAYKVKEALQQKFAQGNNFIERGTFDQIAKDNGVKPEEHEQLLTDLHDLGICLWYNEAGMCNFKTMVLNPSWISHGIYRLINWGLKNEKDSLSILDFREAFTETDVPKYEGKAAFLFSLMNVYQLAFFKNSEEIFVPLLLPVDRTDSNLLPVFNFGERLRMEYHANQALPPYTVARLAVLYSEHLVKKQSWRFGAVLRWEEEGVNALVEECGFARSVTVSVSGSKQTEYIAKLRKTLNSIFDDYKSRRPELKYEILRSDVETNYIDKPLSSHNSDEYLQTEKQIVKDIKVSRELRPNADLRKTLGYDPEKEVERYAVYIGCTIVTQGDYSSTVIDRSQTINLRFQECSINFQEELMALARKFRELETPDNIDLAKELEGVASDLNDSIKEIPVNVTPDSSEMKDVKLSLQRKGLLKRLKNLYEKLCNEKSNMRKKISNFDENETLQKVMEGYKAVAPWLGLILKAVAHG